MFGWLIGAVLASSVVLAAQQQQDPEKQNQPVSAERDGGAFGEEKLKEIGSRVTVEQDFFATPHHSFTRLAGDFLKDQKQIWTSPAKLRFSDTQWLVPLSGIAAGLFVTDRDFSRHLSQNPTTIHHYKTLSNGGVAALVGSGAGMWLLGHASHNEHWSETGFLAGEAALNSLVMV